MNSSWISVDERLPKQNGDYLVYYVYEDMQFCSVCRFSMYLEMFSEDHDYVTHWQPLPQPPVAESEK